MNTAYIVDVPFDLLNQAIEYCLEDCRNVSASKTEVTLAGRFLFHLFHQDLGMLGTITLRKLLSNQSEIIVTESKDAADFFSKTFARGLLENPDRPLIGSEHIWTLVNHLRPKITRTDLTQEQQQEDLDRATRMLIGEISRNREQYLMDAVYDLINRLIDANIGWTEYEQITKSLSTRETTFEDDVACIRIHELNHDKEIVRNAWLAVRKKKKTFADEKDSFNKAIDQDRLVLMKNGQKYPRRYEIARAEAEKRGEK